MRADTLRQQRCQGGMTGGMTGAGTSAAGRGACPALPSSTVPREKGRTFLSGPSVICSPCDSAWSLTAARKGANAAEGR